MKQETISALGTQSRRSASGHNSLCNAWKHCPLSVGRLLLITLLLFAFTGGAKAEEKTLTVYEGTVTNYYVPANIYYFDYFSRSQVVIPASDLTEMKNGAITALTFYTTNNNVPYETKSEADVYLKEVNYTTMSAFEPKAGATVVYQGTLSIVSDNGGGKLTIEFVTPFIYQGGNLLIGSENTTDLGWKGIYYYGQSVNNAPAFYGYDETSLDNIKGGSENFIPKTTFTYDPSGTACLRPSLTVGGITHSQATLTFGGGSGTYNVQYKKASDTNWAVVASSSTNTTFTLTGLSPLTAYEAQVQSVCDASATSSWRAITFTTTAEGEAVGDSWSDEFEGNTCGWELVNGDLTNEWTWGTATQLGGSKALYISNDGGTTNAYNNTGTKVFATKLLTFTEGIHEIAFDWKAQGESTYDFLRAALVPATQTLTAGTDDGGIGTTSLPEGWIAVDGGNKLNLADEWQRQSTVVNVSAGNYYLVFAWRNDSSNDYNPPAAVDNVSITRLTCQSEVTGLAVSDLTPNSATLTWTPTGDATQWEVAYSINASFDGATTQIVNTGNCSISNLQPNTHYHAKVRAYCGGTSYGTWSEVKQFVTDCGTITQYPWTENFDSYTASAARLPDCWRSINTTVSYYSNYPKIYNYSAKSGTNCLYFYSYAYFSSGSTTYDPQDQYAILPKMENLGGKQITLYAKASYANSTFKIGVMSNPTDATTFTAIAPEQVLTTSYEEYTYIIPEGTTAIHIAIMMEAADESRNTNSVYIDDITIDVPPACPVPTYLVCSSSTTNSATFSWTENGDANDWQICINGDETHLIAANSNPFTVTGLDAGTAFTAKVRSVKGGDHSKWSKEISFVTACDAITNFPWNENFESYPSGDFHPLCWENEHISGSGSSLFRVYTSTNGGNNTHQLQLPDQSAGTFTKLVLPKMTLPDNDYNFVFDVYRDNSYSSKTNEGIRVYVSTDDNIVGATELAFIPRVYSASGTNNIPAETAPGWYTYELSLGKSGTCYIILQGESQYGAATYMDNFIVRLKPACPKPTNLTVGTVTSNSAILSWTETGTATSWQICIDDNEAKTITADSNPFTVTGLSSNTAYTAKVRACNSETEQSDWTRAVTFQTECGPLSLPYFCGFENVDNLQCWTLTDCHSITGVSPTGNHSGNRCFSFYFTQTPPQYLISPELDGTSAIDVSFYYKNHLDDYKETFQVGFSTTSNLDDFKWGDEVEAADENNWMLYEETFPKGTKYVAIKCTSDDRYHLLIDDFSILANDDDKDFAITTDNVVQAFMTTYDEVAGRDYTKVVNQARKGQMVTLSWDGETVPGGNYVTGFNITKEKGGTVTATPNADDQDYYFIMPADNVTVQTIIAPQEEYTIHLAAEGDVQVVPEIMAQMLTMLDAFRSDDTSYNMYFDLDGDGTNDIQLVKPTNGKNSTDPYANDYTVRRLAGADAATVTNCKFNFVYPFPYRYNRVQFKLGKETTVSNVILSASTSNEFELNEYNGQTVNVTIFGGKLYKDGDWNTLCLPFEVTLDSSPLSGDNVEVRELVEASISGTTLNLIFNDNASSPVTTLSPGKPYIIKWTGEGLEPIYDPKFNGVTINKTLNGFDNNVVGDGRVRFVGIYEPIEFRNEDRSILLLGENNTLFYPKPELHEPENQGSFWSYPYIGAFHAYFKIGDDEAPARTITAFNMSFGDGCEASGIKDVHRSVADGPSNNWYTLDGRKLDKQPSRKGLYIRGGKKVVIKK